MENRKEEGIKMLKYEDLAILPYQSESRWDFCAICGRNLKYVKEPNSNRYYGFCSKCKIITHYIE